MKVYILTQEEPFYLPVFFSRLFRILPDSVEITGLTAFQPFNSQDSWVGVIKDHLGYYGLPAFLRQGFHFAGLKALNFLQGSRISSRARPYSVANCCKAFGIEQKTFTNVNSKKFRAFLQQEKIDLLVSVACPQIFRKGTLELPSKGAINLHSAKLPHYRGIAPLFWAMLAGEKEAAVSIHEIDAAIDEGPLLAQKVFPIQEGDSLDDLYKKLISMGPRLMAQVLQEIEAGQAQARVQKDEEGSYFGFPTPEAGRAFRKKGLKFF